MNIDLRHYFIVPLITKSRFYLHKIMDTAKYLFKYLIFENILLYLRMFNLKNTAMKKLLFYFIVALFWGSTLVHQRMLNKMFHFPISRKFKTRLFQTFTELKPVIIRIFECRRRNQRVFNKNI